MKKQKTKIYIRTFIFEDGTKKSIEGDGKFMMKHRGPWARKKFKVKKFKGITDSVRFE